MKIYTKTGDRGDTGLIGGRRVRKSEPRVAAYGEVDELNCALGAALSVMSAHENVVAVQLRRIQEELFVVGALLAGQDAALPKDAVPRLEQEIDDLTSELPPLKKFVLPGGGRAGAALHLARAVCRRAERAVVGLDGAPEGVVVYLNRLSDHLFTAARWVNQRARAGETLWAGLPQR